MSVPKLPRIHLHFSVALPSPELGSLHDTFAAIGLRLGVPFATGHDRG
jgi:hypothetical protein